MKERITIRETAEILDVSTRKILYLLSRDMLISVYDENGGFAGIDKKSVEDCHDNADEIDKKYNIVPVCKRDTGKC